MKIKKRPGTAGLLFVIILFDLSAFTLAAFHTQPVDINALIMGALSSGLLLFQYFLFVICFKHTDKYVLIIMNILAGIGFVVQYRLNPDIAMKQIESFGLGMVVMVAAFAVVKKYDKLDKYTDFYMIAGLMLLFITQVLGVTRGGSKNWIQLGSHTIQLSEFVKIFLLFALAGTLKVKKRKRELWKLFLFIAFSLIFLVLQKDLGAALLYFMTSLIIIYVSTSNLLLTGAGFGLGALGSVISYKLFDHVRVRVQVWRDPWSDIATKGYQIAQSLMAIASGGLLGLGLYRGSPKTIPAYSTDFIFAVICEEFGIIIGIAVVAFYVILVVRGAMIALDSHDRFYGLLAFGCTSMITLQSFIIIGGVIKMIPLTGITLPFISYGGSSMIVSMAMIGILEGISERNGAVNDPDKDKSTENQEVKDNG